RLYGGSGVASSAEEVKRGTPRPAMPSCRTSLRAPLAAAPSKWRSGRTLGGKRGGIAPRGPSDHQPWAVRRAASALVLWRRTLVVQRSSRSPARLSKTAAPSGLKGHGLAKYLSSLTSECGANIQVPDRFSCDGWPPTYFVRRGNCCRRGVIRAGLG